MRNDPEPGVVDLRAVGRDQLAHVIARALAANARASERRPPFIETYSLAEQVADQIERLGWQVLRPHREGRK